MNESDHLDQRVFDAIGKGHYVGRLVITNESADRLRDLGPAVLPAVERVLSKAAGLHTAEQIRERFGGLGDVGSVQFTYFEMAEDNPHPLTPLPRVPPC